MAKRRVVITGLGIVSPVGMGVAQAWQNIVAGKSGIGRVVQTAFLFYGLWAMVSKA